MNNQLIKTHPKAQQDQKKTQLQLLNLEQLDSVAGGCACKGTFERSKPHVNVSS